SRAESVAGREQHGVAFPAEARAELADRRRLARAVHADDEDHEGPACAVYVERYLDRLQKLEQRIPQCFLRRFLRAAFRLAQALDQPRRHFDADVGREEPLLELLERRLVDAAAEEAAREPRAPP